MGSADSKLKWFLLLKLTFCQKQTQSTKSTVATFKPDWAIKNWSRPFQVIKIDFQSRKLNKYFYPAHLPLPQFPNQTFKIKKLLIRQKCKMMDSKSGLIFTKTFPVIQLQKLLK